MAGFTLRLRRYDPEAGQPAYWEKYTVDLEGHRSVLDAILEARARFDGSIGIRCSCRAAICGSCGVRINGQPCLACHIQLGKAQSSGRDGVIEVEPMGNMPVLKDLIVDMDAVHWRKIDRVQPWLINKEPIPEREYLAPHESMVDVTQSMACIQCGACVSDCLSMEVDPEFVGPAALAKAYRFVGDPRDDRHFERLKDLAEDPHGIYDCTHCFMCIDACPKGVAPMSQIMRLRRRATADHGISDRNNGERHGRAFVENIRRNGLLHEADLLPDSYGGKLDPRAMRELIDSLPSIAKALLRRKVTLRTVLSHPHRKEFRELRGLIDAIEGRAQRYELNLYVSGYDEESDRDAGAPTVAGDEGMTSAPGPDPHRPNPEGSAPAR